MQIMLLQFGDVLLKNQGKKTNRAVIEQMTGIQNYDAYEAQIRELCSRIDELPENELTSCFDSMLRDIQKFEKDLEIILFGH